MVGRPEKKMAVTLTYYVNKTFDGKELVQEASSLKPQVISFEQLGLLTSTDPTNCPLKEFKITQMQDQDGVVIDPQKLQSILTFDSSAGTILFRNYSSLHPI